MKTIITLLLSKCSLADRLTIERILQEIKIEKPDSLLAKVYFLDWLDIEVLELIPFSSVEFEYIHFIVHKFNDLKDEIKGFDYEFEQFEKKDPTTIDFIQQTVCTYFHVPIEILHSPTRKREIVQARQIAMYFSKILTKSSLATIGSQIGDKDHATCLHAIKTVNNLRETDKRFRLQLDEIEKRLKA